MAFALISAYDRTGILGLARALQESGYKLLSTGGTHRCLSEAGLTVTLVSDVTGFPEILGGRVKTLHPRIHGGLLAKRADKGHMHELQDHGIEPVDFVVSNLYPFQDVISDADASLEDALENIDIGGPSMIRAAAKNFMSVVVVVDPSDYKPIANLVSSGGVGEKKRRSLAAKAFSHVASYDLKVTRYLQTDVNSEEDFPEELFTTWKRVKKLRYGENPHQKGVLYKKLESNSGLASASQLHGGEMGYINYLDADSAWRSVATLPDNSVSIVKHANPCGLASHKNQAEAYRRALAGDPISAYGGIVGFNSTVEAETAEAMKGVLYHVIVAPRYRPKALALLKERTNLRILELEPAKTISVVYRSISGGLLAQIPDSLCNDSSDWEVKSEREPTRDEMKDLEFAWHVCAMVKSNGIVMAKDRAVVGIGAGQPNRVTSVDIASRVAGKASAGSVLASDAFFPFPDGIDAAGEAGCTAVVAPGGSIRDQEIIKAADKHNIALMFASKRHFLH